MALVALLRGVNVGGHRTFRPSELAKALTHLDVINIGAAGTFVVRKPVTRAKLRDELTRRISFDATVVICDGREILALIDENPFGKRAPAADVVRFVSVLSQRPKHVPEEAVVFPASGPWQMRVVGVSGRYIFGEYRRSMKVIGYLGALDRLFGAPVTTRNWNTIMAIAHVLG